MAADPDPRATMTGMWAKGEAYEPYIGRWSRPVAERFVAWLAPARGDRWLDVGCGTGALTEAVLATGPAAVLGVDPAPGFVGYARERVGGRAAFAVADAAALPARDGSVDRVVSGLVLNFLPDPPAAVAGMARACRPGGTVAGYVWDYGGGMQLVERFWAAATAVDPAAADRDEFRRFGYWQPDELTGLLAGAGLTGVRTTEITVPTVFRDFADYWTPFLGGQGPAPAYLAQLPAGTRDRVRDRLRASLPAGPIRLTARAYAVRGTA